MFLVMELILFAMVYMLVTQNIRFFPNIFPLYFSIINFQYILQTFLYRCLLALLLFLYCLAWKYLNSIFKLINFYQFFLIIAHRLYPLLRCGHLSLGGIGSNLVFEISFSRFRFFQILWKIFVFRIRLFFYSCLNPCFDFWRGIRTWFFHMSIVYLIFP